MFRNKYIFAFLMLFISLSTLGQENTVPGELIVQLAPEISQKNFDSSKIPFEGWEFNDCLSKHANIWLVSFNQNEILSERILREFAFHPEVTVAQFNHKVEMREVPNDPLFGEQWQHVNDNDADMDTDLAWDITTGGTTAAGDEIVVCVIEGANLEHPDLIDNKWVNQNEIPNNGIDDDSNGYIDDYLGWNVNTEDDSGVLTGSHGTGVSGCVAAKGNNELGVVGVNWDVKIMSVAGESVFDEASVIEAYDYALNMRMLYNSTEGEQGAFVVSTNASWGIDSGDPGDVPLWCAFYDTLGVHGILSCGATTNNTSLNIDVAGDIPTGCDSDYLFSVTATNSNDVRSTGGYGPIGVDLAAPGGGVYGLSNTSYGSLNGTSFASPHVAGAIALLYSAPCPAFVSLMQSNPGEAALLIKQSIMNSVDPVAELEGITVTGGRMNVHAALMELLSLCASDDCLAPFSITANLLSGTDYQITWQSLTAETFDLRYRLVDDPEWTTIVGIEENAYVLEGLLMCADYEVQVQAYCDPESPSGWSASTVFVSNGCCEAPDVDTFEILNIDSASVQLTWGEILPANGYEVGISLAGEVNFIFVSTNGNTISIDELQPCTSYDMVVAPDCDELAISEIFTFTTEGCGACVGNEYCMPTLPNANAEWIESVSIGEYENVSGSDDGYGDYTNGSFSLSENQEYTITLVPGFAGFQYSEYFKAWIDYDQSGTFDEDEEVIFESEAPENTEVSGTFSILPDALPGSTRLRVAMKWSNNNTVELDPCESFDYGEIEDYCVFLDMSSSVTETLTDRKVRIYPNPFAGSLTIANPYNKAEILLYDQFGRLVRKESIAQGENRLAISELASGMYFYQIIQNGKSIGNGKLIKE